MFMYSKTNFLKACELLKFWHSSVAWLYMFKVTQVCNLFHVYTVPWFRGRTREVGQIHLAGDFIDPRLHSDPAHGADPEVGQIEWAQVRNFSCYTWKSSIHCGGRPSFLFTQKKKAVSDPTCGVEPYKFGGVLTNGGSDPSMGAGDLCLHWGAKGGVYTPHLGFDPAIGAMCKRGTGVIFISPQAI